MTLEEFYRDNYRIVYGYLLSLCGNVTIAEDLASETFLRAMRKIESYDGTCKPSTWLCTIARNLYFNETKRQSRCVTLDEIEMAEPVLFEEQYVENEEAECIFRAASQLQPIHRQVFFMRVRGLSFREIGFATGKSENWSRVTFFRAKNTIVERLEENNGSLRYCP